MNCTDFNERIAEFVAGEVTPELKTEMAAHEQICLTCRQTVAHWREMEMLVRASLPAEEPRRSFFVPFPPRRTGWLETARTLFGLTSMASVAACLLLIAIFRPSVHLDRSQLSVNFAPSSIESTAATAPVMTEAQVRSLVQQLLAKDVALQKAGGPTASTPITLIPATSEDANRMSQLAVQVQMLKENQFALWQQVQQHGLYLQSAWRPPSVQP